MKLNTLKVKFLELLLVEVKLCGFTFAFLYAKLTYSCLHAQAYIHTHTQTPTSLAAAASLSTEQTANQQDHSESSQTKPDQKITKESYMCFQNKSKTILQISSQGSDLSDLRLYVGYSRNICSHCTEKL